jgi:BolA protein
MPSTAPVTAAAIESRLREALAPVELSVRDDSAHHAGHAGAGSGGHFHVVIRARCFTGRARLARHRLVYDALDGWLRAGIHALSVDADVPQPGS